MRKIYIDGLGLVDGHFSGVGQYILGILQGMDELIDERRAVSMPTPIVSVVIPRDKVARFRSFGLKNIRYKTLPIPFRYMAKLWHHGLMPPIDIWCGRGDYFFPRFVDMPLLFSRNRGLVIFDLSYELHRQYSDEGNAHFLSNKVKKSVARTKNIVTISQNAKNEIVNFYKVPSNRVFVATPAADQRVFYRRSPKEVEDVKQKYGITAKNYILALSNLEPRKNLQALVDAYCRLPAAVRKDTALLLVGVSGWKADALFNTIIDKVGEGYDIIRPNKYVSDNDKPAIISGASLLVYPSHYEGFGMPPLEALACGVPVITSDNSSLPEVVEGVGTMVDVSDGNDQLSEALANAMRNIDTLKEKALTEGPQRASEFSWKHSAQVFFDLVESKS
ncbi:MAG TPA: glycosyltransferase family 1 protein [Candidatus Saccharibacteria bacterium]|nr:glycosyltransferase family 1 protein [Candidatus Saccharibacteria bacterium]HRK93978.1 glycosyltransferase family 1 protein [Candidatus Saccharibacteria bacterium]